MKISTEKIQKGVHVRIVHVHILLHIKDLNLSNVHEKGNTLLQPHASTKGAVRGPRLPCWDPQAYRTTALID